MEGRRWVRRGWESWFTGEGKDNGGRKDKGRGRQGGREDKGEGKTR